MDFQEQYFEALKNILIYGVDTEDRTKVGTKSLFNVQITHDMAKGFPILTFRQHWLNIALRETHLFLKGSDDITELQKAGISIWDKHNIDGHIGYAYGKVWRDFVGIDQLEQVLAELKNNNNSRRLVVSAWAPHKFQVLPSCVTMFQLYARNGILNISTTARSTDFWNGFGYDFMQSALLLLVFSKLANLAPGVIVFTTTDAHLYKNGSHAYAKAISNYKTFPLPFLNDCSINSFEDPSILNWAFSMDRPYSSVDTYPRVPIAI
jgi:thymidylate synthase